MPKKENKAAQNSWDEMQQCMQGMYAYLGTDSWAGKLNVFDGKSCFQVFVSHILGANPDTKVDLETSIAVYDKSPALQEFFEKLSLFDPTFYFNKLFNKQNQAKLADFIKNQESISQEQFASLHLMDPQNGIDSHMVSVGFANKEQKRQREFENALDSLKRKVYTPPMPIPGGAEDVAPKLTMEELRAAAHLIVDEEITTENTNYSPIVAAQKYIELESRIKNLATDVDFRGYIQDTLSENKEELFDKETFKRGWENYKKEIHNEYMRMPKTMKSYPFFSSRGICQYQPENIVNAAHQEEEEPERLDNSMQSEDLNRSINLSEDDLNNSNDIIRLADPDVDDNEDLEEIIKIDNVIAERESLAEDSVSENDLQERRREAIYKQRREELKQQIKEYIQGKIDSTTSFFYTDMFKGANMVVAGMLTDPYTSKNFVGRDAGFYHNADGFDTQKLNSKIDQIRTQVLTDPLFKQVMADAPTPGKLYERYKKAVRNEVNRRNTRDGIRISHLMRHPEERKLSEKLAMQLQITLAEDVKEQLMETYQTLLRVNKGKDPSDEMQALMNNLKAVQGKDKLTFTQLDSLNRAALDYHDARKGILFEPFTEKGKLRLQSVENLIRKTDNALEQPRKVLDKQVREGLKNIGKVNEQPKL